MEVSNETRRPLGDASFYLLERMARYRVYSEKERAAGLHSGQVICSPVREFIGMIRRSRGI